MAPVIHVSVGHSLASLGADVGRIVDLSQPDSPVAVLIGIDPPVLVSGDVTRLRVDDLLDYRQHTIVAVTPALLNVLAALLDELQPLDPWVGRALLDEVGERLLLGRDGLVLDVLLGSRLIACHEFVGQELLVSAHHLIDSVDCLERRVDLTDLDPLTVHGCGQDSSRVFVAGRMFERLGQQGVKVVADRRVPHLVFDADPQLIGQCATASLDFRQVKVLDQAKPHSIVLVHTKVAGRWVECGDACLD